MSSYKWWKYRPNTPSRSVTRRVARSLVEQNTARMNLLDTMTENYTESYQLTDAGVVTMNGIPAGPPTVDTDVALGPLAVQVHTGIDAANVTLDGITSHSDHHYIGQTITDAIETLDSRVGMLEHPPLNHMINDGNMCNLTNSLRQLSSEGYLENELTDVLRVLIERGRSGEVQT